jgi:hypothetical protein
MPCKKVQTCSGEHRWNVRENCFLTILIPASIFPRTFFTTAQTSPIESPVETETERFKIRLPLSAAADLKVRKGNEVAILQGRGFANGGAGGAGWRWG